MWEFDPASGRLLSVNDAYCAMSGFDRAELLDMTVADLDHGHPKHEVIARYADRAERGPSRWRTRHRRNGGGTFPVEVTAAVRGTPVGTVAFVFLHDATDREGADRTLADKAEWLRLAQEAAKAGTWDWDLRTDKNTWSEEVWKLYGLEPGSCEPSYASWLESIHPDDRLAAHQMVQEAVDHRAELNVEWRVGNDDGDERWMMLRGQPVCDAKGRAARYIGVVMDITERKRAEEEREQRRELLALSTHDDLTGLLNRRGFIAIGEQELARARRNGTPLAVLYADVDDLKCINDTYGHLSGDEVLRQAATVLRATFRESDAIARVGGDEFAVLLAADESQDASSALARLQAQLEAGESGQTPWALRMSAGFVLHELADEPDVDIFTLLHRADFEMYLDKEARRAVTAERRGTRRAAAPGKAGRGTATAPGGGAASAVGPQPAAPEADETDEDLGAWRHETATGMLTLTPPRSAMMGLSETRADVFAVIGHLVHADDRDRVRDTVAQSLADGKPRPLAFRVLRPDGSERSVNVRSVAETDDTHQVVAFVGIVEDVTEREQAERVLRENEKLFRTLFRSSPVCATLTRLSDARVLDVSGSYLRTFGYERDEVLGQGLPVADTWADPAQRERMMEVLRQEGSVPGTEVPFRTKRGAAGVMFAAAELVEVAGEPCALTLGIDMTDLKVAQGQAAERESQLLATIENAPFGAHLYRLDPDDRLVFVGYNHQAEVELGIDHSTLAGRTLEEIFPGNVGTETPEAYRRVAREGGAWEADEFAYDSGGIAGVFEVRAFSIGDMRVAVFFRDVTEKRRLENAMKESERKLMLALKAADLGVWEYDVATGARRHDAAACRLLGLDPAIFKGTSEEFYAVVHPDDCEALEATGVRAIERGTQYAARYRVIWPDGSVHWIAAHGDKLCDAAGTVVRWQGVLEDVTDQELTRERLGSTVRTLKALSWCNQTLVRAMDEQTLLRDVCQVGVTEGGYRMVWVGYAENDEARTVRPMGSAGHEEGFLQSVHFNWSDEDVEHNGPPGLAIRTKEPVVVRSIDDDPRYRPFAKEALARGYASVAAFPLFDNDRHPFGAIMFLSGLHEAFDSDEMLLLQEFATDLAYGIQALRTRELEIRFEGDLLVANEKLDGLLRSVIQGMSRVVETRDPYTQGHQVRVAGLARAIAAELGMHAAEIEGIYIASLVHDIGKLGIPSEILTKPTCLTDTEFRWIREHPAAGYGILKDIDFLWPVADMVVQHHERLDGSGYPNGLKGDEILRGARVIAVADVVEAMASHRPYRPALDLQTALEEVSDGERYDPEVAAACVRLFETGHYSLEH